MEGEGLRSTILGGVTVGARRWGETAAGTELDFASFASHGVATNMNRGATLHGARATLWLFFNPFSPTLFTTRE